MSDVPSPTQHVPSEADRLRLELENTRRRLQQAERQLEPLRTQVLRLRAEMSWRQQLQESLLKRPRYRLADRVAQLLKPLTSRRPHSRHRTRPAVASPPATMPAPNHRVALIVALEVVPVALESLARDVGELAAAHDVRPIFVVSASDTEPLARRRIECEAIPPRHPWTQLTGGDYDDFVQRRLASVIEVYEPSFVVSACDRSDVRVIAAGLRAVFGRATSPAPS